MVQEPVVLPALTQNPYSWRRGKLTRVFTGWHLCRWGDRMHMALKKPRWNHGLSHVGHVGHASPGDHHGIARRLDAWSASGLCCVRPLVLFPLIHFSNWLPGADAGIQIYRRQIVCSCSGDQNLSRERHVLQKQPAYCSVALDRTGCQAGTC